MTHNSQNKLWRVLVPERFGLSTAASRPADDVKTRVQALARFAFVLAHVRGRWGWGDRIRFLSL